MRISLSKWPPELPLGFMLFHNAPYEKYRPFENNTILDLHHDRFGVLYCIVLIGAFISIFSNQLIAPQGSKF